MRLDRLTAAWVAQLDVDLERAQAVLRLPAADRPIPPMGLPAELARDWDGELVELAPAVPPPGTPPAKRVGAYGRRRGA